jgi:protein TonB
VFRDVRRDSLPKIVIERYAAAKAAFERKDPAASQQFDEVLALLDDPDLQASAALKDLREVAAAFRDLTKAIGASAAAAAAARQDGSPAAPQRPPAPPPVADIIYTSADSDVVPPVAQSQKMPPWRPARNEAVQEFRGALRLLIDQSGAVVSATIPASTRPAYDQLLLRAARDWKFQPARKDGAAVRYLKVIEIRLTSTPQ